MNFNDLKDYLVNKMRMSHIYQPVMIKELLRINGPVTAYNIAKRFVEFDGSQIEYYEQITNKMPGLVLRRHGVVIKTDAGYLLDLDSGSLSDVQREELIKLCDKKISEYIERRGDRIWQHRRLNDRVVPGSIRYEVLKRAHFRCELCGVSADERAIEVDHIIPHNLKGPDEIDNYQALCYKCNANKRDTDQVDFRDWGTLHNSSDSNCVFCYPDKARVLEVSELAYVLKDGYPVTEGHILVIPKRHVSSFFELYAPETNACIRLLNDFKQRIESADTVVRGFNIGVNVGMAGGQTIPHCHWHLIPRRSGDVPNPNGGVRNLIPGKGDYTDKLAPIRMIST